MHDIRVMAVDDCGMIREIIALLLASEPRIDCIAQAETGSEAFQQLAQNSVDVVTLDIELPDMDGIAMIGAVKQLGHCEVIVISGSDDRYPQAMAAGAMACFNKSDLMSNRAAFVDAIRAADRWGKSDASSPADWLKSC